MYSSETQGIVITVTPNFLADESDPEVNRFIWSYTVEIANTGPDPIQLIGREWQITDGHNKTQCVQGDGVIGKQPVIAPGDRFTYASGVPLTTPTGFMGGTYVMKRGAERFDAHIPRFALDCDYNPVTWH